MTDPRVERSMKTVREAALVELAMVGYGRLSIDGVARRAGVARTTIYRHWPDLPTLVLDSLGALHRQPHADDGATPRERIHQLLHHLVDAMADPLVSAVQAALVDGAARDPRLAELLHRSADGRRAALVDAVRAGRRRRQVRPGVDPELAATALAGAVLYRRLVTATPFEHRDVEALVELVLGPAPQ